MVYHNVFFWLKSRLSNKEIEDFKEFFERLRPIPVVKHLNVGIPAGTESRPVVDNSYTYALQIAFESLEDHNTYQAHEYHQQAVKVYSKYWDRVLVHDFEVL